MSILPVQAQQHLTSYQATALDQQYNQDASLIASATAGPSKTGDTLFVSLNGQIALQQFEKSQSQPVDDPTQAQDAAVVQSMTDTPSTPSFGFTQIDQQVALNQYMTKT